MKKKALILIVIVGLCFIARELMSKKDAPLASEPSAAFSDLPAAQPEAEIDVTPNEIYPHPVGTLNTGNKPVAKIFTQEQFKKLTNRIYDTMPTVKDLRNTTAEEAHHTPPVLVKAAEGLGEVAQALSDNPSLVHEAASFYKNCSYNAEFPKSVRAVCYSDFKNLNSEVVGEQSDSAQIPEDVRSLAEKL
jgi:hypothetical protein